MPARNNNFKIQDGSCTIKSFIGFCHSSISREAYFHIREQVNPNIIAQWLSEITRKLSKGVDL